MNSAFVKRTNSGRESGQAFLFVVLGLGIFLIGAMAFAIDLSNLWFRRQAAQTAADAACTAGAMDLLVDDNTGVTNQGGFETKSGATQDANPFSCKNNNKAGGTPAPCTYAQYNGFPGTLSQSQFNSGNLGNYVWFAWSPNAATPSGVSTPSSAVVPVAFLQVQIKSNMPTFFAGLLKGQKTESITANAICGVEQAAAPIPIVVLDPESPPNATPAQAALDIQGTPTIKIFGGPQRSIQVDSLAAASGCGSSNCSVNLPWGTATIDLSGGGPSPSTGSDIGLSGGPTTAPSGFNGGTTGHWIAPASPIGDPFAQVCFPGQTGCTYQINGNSVPSAPTSVYVPTDLNTTVAPGCSPATAATIQAGNCVIPYKFHGCPDQNTGANKGCRLFEPGPYPSGISVSGGSITAVFDPGLYYITGGLSLGAGSLARPGTGDANNPADGVTFYFVGNGTVSVTSDSGSRTSLVDSFNTYNGPVDSSGNQYGTYYAYNLGVRCLSTSSVPTNLKGTPSGTGVNLGGNILLGPCTGYYGDPLGSSEPTSASTPPGSGEQRYFLFFQDRSATGSPAGKGVQPSWQGSGVFTLAGAMYFHSCNSSGTGLSCTPAPSNYWNDIFSLGGTSGSQTYVLGEIITDNLQLGGNATINMDLNPTTVFTLLKASLFQ